MPAREYNATAGQYEKTHPSFLRIRCQTCCGYLLMYTRSIAPILFEEKAAVYCIFRSKDQV